MDIRDFFIRPGWAFKQLLPLRYETNYVEDGKPHFCRWRMWFGRCFDVKDIVVAIADCDPI